MTHAYTKEDKRYKKDLIDRIKQTYYPAAKRSNSEIIPVGEAYEIAYQKQPNIELHHPDGTHPGMLGTYLGAATVFAVIANNPLKDFRIITSIEFPMRIEFFKRLPGKHIFKVKSYKRG